MVIRCCARIVRSIATVSPSGSRNRSVTLAGAVCGLLIRMKVVKKLPVAPFAWNHEVDGAALATLAWPPVHRRVGSGVKYIARSLLIGSTDVIFMPNDRSRSSG